MYQLKSEGAYPGSLLEGAFSPGAQKWVPAEIFDIYTRMRAHRRAYEIGWGATELAVLPDVYAPHFFTDSFWFAGRLPAIVGNKTVLEIGTGTGIIAIACALQGARVVATDINPSAAQNATINATRHRLDISIRVGNLYEPLRSDEKFDHIFFLHPFNNCHTFINDPLLLTGLDYHYRALKGYISGARDHLKVGGKLLLGTADTADLLTIFMTAHKHGYSQHVLARGNSCLCFGGKRPIEYILYEFVRKM